MRNKFIFTKKRFLFPFLILVMSNSITAGLDPLSKAHLFIGLPNTLDPLKTVVESEGIFSPGLNTFGVYFWLYADNKLYTPTELPCDKGLTGKGILIPWVSWNAGAIKFKEEICEVGLPYNNDTAFVTSVRISLQNTSPEPKTCSFIAAVRSLGPAGGKIRSMSLPDNRTILVNGYTALCSSIPADFYGASSTDSIGVKANLNSVPTMTNVTSNEGTCSGALKFTINLQPGEKKIFAFNCPVLAGQKVGHHAWVSAGGFYKDTATLHPNSSGDPQPDPGIDYYKNLQSDKLFATADSFWNAWSKPTISVPDSTWSEAFHAINAHLLMCVNDWAPDVSAVNYNTYNRDGFYMLYTMLNAGNFTFAGDMIEKYFMKHPFSGRPFPEADNPGQILWCSTLQWLYSRDKSWLQRVYPDIQKVINLIEYHRTTPTPHYVDMNSLNFGNDVPTSIRKVLSPGSCDGYNPAYTCAFDLAGMRGAKLLTSEMGNKDDSAKVSQLVKLFETEYTYSRGSGYYGYAVLWPCRVFNLDTSKQASEYKNLQAQTCSKWRYFGLATAHQGLYAGSRIAGYGTLQNHLTMDQMKNWYLFDEGPYSGIGSWDRINTLWTKDRAMPHGWAVAELVLLLRDCIAFENEKRVVLLGGVPPTWFTSGNKPISIDNLPTWYGSLSFTYAPMAGKATLKLGSTCTPPEGFILRLPSTMSDAKVTANGQTVVKAPTSTDFYIPVNARDITIESSSINGSVGVMSTRTQKPPTFSIIKKLNYLEIHTDKPIGNAEICNLKGSVIAHAKQKSKNIYMYDLQLIKNGCYLLRIDNHAINMKIFR